MERKSIKYWLPKVQQTGLPVPVTMFVDMPNDIVHRAVFEREYILGESSSKRSSSPLAIILGQVIKTWMRDIKSSSAVVKTDTGFAKRQWSSCIVNEVGLQSLSKTVVYSMYFHNACGLDIRNMVVQEVIPTDPACTAFESLPITNQRRFFIKDGELVCHHPYWHPDQLKGQIQGEKSLDEIMAVINSQSDSEAILSDHVKKIAKEFASDGSWSIDFLQAKNKTWYVQGMAPANVSYHWPDCAFAPKFSTYF